ncbi:unnamed protein product [Thelazia callipaeda]|uniref:Protein kish n=1 Tax=Thelazia callipaeda TaxID=103827 RepID=A0A0N5CN05_THECL|nr:unnamed protein product [Thelazia callipaeda]
MICCVNFDIASSCDGRKGHFPVTYSLDGAVVIGLLLICTCAYLKRIPRLNSWFLSDKKGFFGIFYKFH